MLRAAAIFVFVSVLPSLCVAASCEDYPNNSGINPELVDGKLKIVATGTAVVSFDDPSAIADARTEATLLAKGEISNFLNQGIRNEQTVNRAVQETKSMQGDSKAAARKEAVERLTQLGSSSQALLKGVVPLGECYTKGQEFRVSVGVKPETIDMADTLSQGMSSSPTRGPNVGPQGAPPSQRLNGMDSFSRTEGLKKF